MSRTTTGGDLPAARVGRLESTWTAVGGLPIHALVSADPPRAAAGRPPVVLVHGLGLSCRYMVPLARHLAGDFRVFAPDLPGFGDSGKPDDILDVPGLADALAAWVQAAGLRGRVAPVGNSFGCQVIADFAARHPELVDRAVLQGPTTPPDERTWLRQFVRWRQNQPYNPPAMGPVTWRDYRKAGLRRLYRTFRHVLRDPVEDKLPGIRAPVLVVRGQLDPICRLPWATEVARLLPEGRLAEIPGVAHTLCYTAPVELAAVTRTFLDEGRAAKGRQEDGRADGGAGPAARYGAAAGAERRAS